MRVGWIEGRVRFEEGEELVEFDGAVAVRVDLLDDGFDLLFRGVEGEFLHDFLEFLHVRASTQGVMSPSPLTSIILKASLNSSVCSGLSFVIILVARYK